MYTKTGALVQPPAQTASGGEGDPDQHKIYDNLCDFTCSRGYFPSGTCMSKDDIAISHINPEFIWGGTGKAVCDADQRPKILREFRFAILMAKLAQENVQPWDYYEIFFSEGVRNKENFAQTASVVYEAVVSMLQGSSSFGLQVTYDNGANPCKKVKSPDLTYTNAGKKTVNICEGFFQMEETSLRYIHPPKSIKDAHRTRAAILVHEMTHSMFAMKPTAQSQARDYAYGWESCKELAAGTFNRGCQEYAGLMGMLCANPTDPKKDGVCDANFSEHNVDTWAVVAAGTFFSEAAGKAIPLYPPTAVFTRADSGCIQHDDIMFDQGCGF
ncbi:hypothetical protein N7447_007064 [Penicillium robsamsonii]|uniref:uncharacterized protein n=1 Tax=Penicillium robsamsonii TaxID=1792511 RepID=UPI002548A607|nr:uncharacterized protein N7447_007064 [Penicillium robsamsonii]KAJ5824724.1 hypothetical protein N7447_007064 [Penicillium robsamsonii]